MTDDAAELPLLRYRDETYEDLWFERPVVLMGRFTRVDFDCVTLVRGPALPIEIYLEDLASLFDDDEALAMSVFADAMEHGDTVKIELARDRISYDNAKQLARLAAAAT